MNCINSVAIYRRQEREVIEQLLANDYYDAPICFFSPSLIRAAAEWMADNDRIFFLVAEVPHERAGYLFAHTYGPQLWRAFARRHPHFVLQLMYVLWRQKMCSPKANGMRRGMHARPVRDDGSHGDLAVPKISTPFRWTCPDVTKAYVDMVYVAERYRGQGLASSLLQSLVQMANKESIHRIEAHIDSSNPVSVRAFLRANWNVVETASGEYQAFWTSQPIS